MSLLPIQFAIAAAALAAVPAALAAGAPKPDPELAQLKVFEGTWRCSGSQHDSIFGPPHAIETTLNGRTGFNGFWTSVRYTEKKTKANPTPTNGIYHYGFDPGAKQFVANWMDNQGGYGRQTTKGWEGDRLVLLGDYVSGGQRLAARDTFTKRGAKSLTHLFELQVSGNWVAVQDGTCRR